MFTGIVEDIGRVTAIEPLTAPSGGVEGAARRLVVEARLLDEALAVGESLAVDGTCLTVTRWERGRIEAVAAAETLARTAIGRLTKGDRVNLERPVRLGDRLGGHLVAGHVDGVGSIAARSFRGEALDLGINAPTDLLLYVIEKGSITVDGVSLTVNSVAAERFEVSLIPHTQEATTLGAKPLGGCVNLEVDLIGKYVERLVGGSVVRPRARPSSNITMDLLREHGFAE